MDVILDLLEKTNVMTTLVESLGHQIHSNVPALSVEACMDIAAGLDYAPVLNMMIHAYDDFTLEEVQMVLDFYDSPAGRKMTNNLPQQMVSMREAMKAWLPTVADAVQEKVNDKMAAL